MPVNEGLPDDRANRKFYITLSQVTANIANVCQIMCVVCIHLFNTLHYIYYILNILNLSLQLKFIFTVITEAL